MAKQKPSSNAIKRKPPKVRIARPDGRPFQLRYTDPDSGKEIRVSCGCRDEDTAEAMKAELEARLLLGVSTTRKKATRGPRMSWEEFRESYRTIRLSQLRDKSAKDAESRLDIATRILKPKTLADVANVEALTRLQSDLLDGKESRQGEPRSPFTVNSNMVAVKVALNWAHEMEWIPSVPKFRKVKTSKLRHAKGRPITGEEFERMLACTEQEVGADAAESWRYVLRGLWSSGLRLGELMNVSWTDDDSAIVPVWTRGRLPVLRIPHEMQKNDTEEDIPLMPGFAKLLQETPAHERTGWAFNPKSLQTKLGRPVRHERSNPEWIGKIVSRIGERAGVVVRTEKGRKKFASAHDLRRSFTELLYDAGVPERVVTQVLRHSSPETTRKYYAPTNVQTSAGILKELMGDCT